MPTYYEILGCDRNASHEELKKGYHEQVKKHHPDKSEEESHRFLLVDKAWKTLRNADARREYDLSLARTEVEEMPLYCEVELDEMDYQPETGTYSYVCRCGGVYELAGSDVTGCERLKVPCDECTFHIVIHVTR